jgi:hypothetical protein
VWSAAAWCLWQAHESDLRVPLDSELFVASQPITDALADPWSELAHPEAVRRYCVNVRRIIHQLRSELKREIKLARRLIFRKREIGPALLARTSRLSALGCYIAAQQTGHADLAGRFVAAAVEQHRSCPLYRAASLTLLPGELYPVDDTDTSNSMIAVYRPPHRLHLADQVCRYREN